MDIRRLEFFIGIAELGSLSRAALVLRISQPSLSRQMRLLEEEVGVALFQRHRRGMVLTQEGAALHKQLVGPLRQIGLAIQDVRSLAKEASGTVVIGMPSSISYILAGPLAKQVAENAHGIELRIREGIAGHLLNSLDQSEIDIALLYGPEPNWRWETEELLTEEFMLVGSADSELSPDMPIHGKELWQYPLILPDAQYQPEALRSFLKVVRELSEKKPRIETVADSFHHTKGSVAAGLGYTLLPISAFQLEAQTQRLRYAPVLNPILRRQVVMTRHPASQFPRAAERVKDLIREEVKCLVENGTWPARLRIAADAHEGD